MFAIGTKRGHAKKRTIEKMLITTAFLQVAVVSVVLLLQSVNNRAANLYDRKIQMTEPADQDILNVDA